MAGKKKIMNRILYIAIAIGLVMATVSCRHSGNSLTVVEEEFLCDTSLVPSCHASTIVELPDGELLAAWFGGSSESADDVVIFMSRKPAGGVWSAPQTVAQDSLHASWNPVLFRIPDGDLLLFYKTGPYVAAWRGHVKRSSDGGRSWSKPFDYPEDMFGAIKDKPLRLSGGRLIAPSSDERFGQWRVHFEISDDCGISWRKVGPLPAPEGVRVIQPSILQLADGTLRALCRSSNGFLAYTDSHDGGDSWTDIQLTDFPHNNSGIDVITTRSGRHLMVCNPVGLSENADTGARTPLSLMESPDGLSWHKLLDLETAPGEYSYPAIIESSDGSLHITYTWRRERIKHVKITSANL